jgi:hypothetical protein
MQLISKKAKAFSTRKVSLNQATMVLSHHGIYADEEQAKTILDFLYLIAKTTGKSEIQVKVLQPEGDVEHEKR